MWGKGTGTFPGFNKRNIIREYTNKIGSMQSAVAEMKGNMTMKAFKEDLGDISYSSISWNIIVELEQKLNNRM